MKIRSRRFRRCQSRNQGHRISVRDVRLGKIDSAIRAKRARARCQFGTAVHCAESA